MTNGRRWRLALALADPDLADRGPDPGDRLDVPDLDRAFVEDLLDLDLDRFARRPGDDAGVADLLDLAVGDDGVLAGRHPFLAHLGGRRDQLHAAQLPQRLL